jgi:hypothetical protein
VISSAAAAAVTAQQVAAAALGWLDAALEHFALPEQVPPAHVDADEKIKPLGELALVASLVIREGAAGHRQAHIAAALAEFAWRQLRDGEVLYELQRANLVATYPVETYAPFVRAGYHHRQLEELLAYLSGLRAAQVVELLPNRALAVVNAQRTVGLPVCADLATLAARTWLGGTPEPWAVDFFTLYAMTHTVFHLTDWGAHPSGLPDHVQVYLCAWLPAWLEVYLEAGQWDLVAELLIVDLCLTEPDFYPHAWECLAGAQHSDGLVPYGPVRVPREVAKAFRNHYHPTLVTAIAGTLAVSRRMTQATRMSSAAP